MSLRKTPLVRCADLDRFAGEVWLKLESLQLTGSFKARGAARAIRALSDAQRRSGVVTASAGNHGAGLALAGGAAGVATTIFVPLGTPDNKLRRMRSLGADLRIEGDDYDASERLARTHAIATDAHFVSAFDDAEVLAGNGGDLAIEIKKQCPELRRVIVPVGGGGLIAGMANELSPSGIEVIGTQPTNNCAMLESLRIGHALCEYQGKRTVAEGCEGGVCERTYEIVAAHELTIHSVSEDSILDAVAFLYGQGVVAEASAAVPIAALRSGLVRQADGVTVLLVSGGNIDDDVLDTILRERGA